MRRASRQVEQLAGLQAQLPRSRRQGAGGWALGRGERPCHGCARAVRCGAVRCGAVRGGRASRIEFPSISPVSGEAGSLPSCSCE